MILEGAGCARWHEADEPTLSSATSAIVEPLAVATCDVDVVMLRGKADFFGTGFVLGHEAVVRVVDVGAEVRERRPGDVAVVPFQISCGACSFCQRGLTAHCGAFPSNPMFGLGPIGGDFGGMLSERFVVPFADHMLVPARDLDPVAIASSSDNLPDAFRCVGYGLELRPSADILVVGGRASSIGLYTILLAKTFGASVSYTDRDPGRIAKAEALGASIVEWRDEGLPTRHDLAIDASGSPTGLVVALRSTAPDGVCINSAMLFGDARLPLFEMYVNGVTLITSRNSSRSYIPNVLELVRGGGFDPTPVTDTVVSWDDAEDALSDPPDKLVIRGPSAA